MAGVKSVEVCGNVTPPGRPQSGLESPLSPLRPPVRRVTRLSGGLAYLRPLPLDRPFGNRSFWHNLAVTAPHSAPPHTHTHKDTHTRNHTHTYGYGRRHDPST